VLLLDRLEEGGSARTRTSKVRGQYAAGRGLRRGGWFADRRVSICCNWRDLACIAAVYWCMMAQLRENARLAACDYRLFG
jgi:hypothetical protein